MSDGSISQNELDQLFGLGDLKELPSEEHIWIVKVRNGGVMGGRCYTLWTAQSLMEKAKKDYPGVEMDVKQIK